MDWDSIHHEGILYVSRKQSPVAFLKQLGIFVGIPTKPNLFWLETTWKVWKITGCRIENITQKHHVGKTKKNLPFYDHDRIRLLFCGPYDSNCILKTAPT